MLAISHAATALLVKRRYPEARMGWILLAAELPAIAWVGLGFAGIEGAGMGMPYSHSVVSLLLAAAVAWLLVGRLLRRRALGAAAALAIVLHLLLDLALHAQQLPFAPFGELRLGLGLHAAPPLAIAAATAYGLACWLVFGGGKGLLAVIVLLTMAQLTFAAPLAVDIAVAIACVWYFSRARAAELEHPSRRLARAFA
ncbi:MAG TPA: hypothetical protein VFZ84_04520 [Burkholderiales bacterium]